MQNVKHRKYSHDKTTKLNSDLGCVITPSLKWYLQKLGETDRLADVNYDKLKVESERLDTHVQKSCNWWIWIMLVMVCGTFIFMVMFMRLMPKKS